jgi:hypothetical protein
MQTLTGMAYLMSGVLTVTLTYYKPVAYWESRSRRFFRRWLGDRPTVILNESLGIILVAIGIVLLSGI